jgi:hypothetical protein
MGVASGFSDKEDSTEYFESPSEFREKVWWKNQLLLV